MKLDTLSYIDSVRSKNQRPLDVIGRILAEIDHFELVLKEKLVTILRTSIFGLFSYQSEQPEGLSSYQMVHQGQCVELMPLVG